MASESKEEQALREAQNAYNKAEQESSHEAGSYELLRAIYHMLVAIHRTLPGE